VITEQLRELEEDRIISRKAFGQRWERVEYELTAYGRTLVPVLTLMAKWGKKHKKLMETKKNPEVGSAACRPLSGMRRIPDSSAIPCARAGGRLLKGL
jgi:hypothetical protein